MTDLQQPVEPGSSPAPVTARPSPATRRRSTVVVAVVVAVLALVAGVLVGRLTAPTAAEPAPPAGLASDEVVSMLTARVAAVNSGDTTAIAAFYTEDAVLVELDQDPAVVTTGAAAIAEHLAAYQRVGFRIEQTGRATIALGPFVTDQLRWTPSAGGLVTYELAEDGRISHQWVTGTTLPPPD